MNEQRVNEIVHEALEAFGDRFAVAIDEAATSPISPEVPTKSSIAKAIKRAARTFILRGDL